MADLKLKDVVRQAQDVIVDEKLFVKKAKVGLGLANEAIKRGLIPTPYFFEAVDYGHKARKLQSFSLAGKTTPKVGDPLMEAIPIYNTVQRRFAGFSNVLEQLWYGKSAPKFKANVDRGFYNPKIPLWSRRVKSYPEEWLYLCLVHRITGSGASFEWDHGWRNNIVSGIAGLNGIELMADHVHEASKKGPMFTSIGNQIPPFNKPTGDWRSGGVEYLVRAAPELVARVYTVLHETARIHEAPMGIKPAVDTVLEIQSSMGHRKFKFVLTAWVMDIAEYMPHLVDPNSDVYHGKNSARALETCFESNMKKQDMFDMGTRLFADDLSTHPMDVEDANPGCDFIRWAENYVPRKGFDHVVERGIFNNNSLKWETGRLRKV